MSISAIELKFLQGLLVDSGDRTPGLSAERFSKDYNIGLRIGRKFIYSENDVLRVRDLLTALNVPLVSQDKATDRAGSSDRTGISEKSGTILPHANSVAFRCFSDDKPVSFPGYQVGEVEDVVGIAPDLMIVVENFETFRQLERYKWLMERLNGKQRTLVIFRGDTIYSLSDAKQCVARLGCEIWGFHDFDPAGLHMSACIPGLVEHIVPPEAVLKAAVMEKKRIDLYYDQLDQYSNELDKCEHIQISSLWVMMKKMQKGLPQEWMRDLLSGNS
jgi:hypothetical protein